MEAGFRCGTRSPINRSRIFLDCHRKWLAGETLCPSFFSITVIQTINLTGAIIYGSQWENTALYTSQAKLDEVIGTRFMRIRD